MKLLLFFTLFCLTLGAANADSFSNNSLLKNLPTGTTIEMGEDLLLNANRGVIALTEAEGVVTETIYYDEWRGRGLLCNLYFKVSTKDRIILKGTKFTVESVEEFKSHMATGVHGAGVTLKLSGLKNVRLLECGIYKNEYVSRLQIKVSELENLLDLIGANLRLAPPEVMD